ncbi:MAG: N-acetylglucosamine-6-phosphate deacetylase, partial [Oscillospiraceae bacterium]|nr:N-acetylglucosamine-6-phosphate deacetylase [Oscillospiraceae bacterium]
DLRTEGAYIAEIGQNLQDEQVTDLSGCLLLPGFVDIHIHGCAGADTCDAVPEAIWKMSSYLPKCGVTSFCPTTMTVSDETIRAALRGVRNVMKHSEKEAGAAVLGVNMEGPYINPRRCGSQKKECVQELNFQQFLSYWEESGKTIKMVDIAPERPNAHAFIEGAKKLCTVSIAHTEADYHSAMSAFQWGITHVTHLFNAMPGLQQRAPGVVGAVFDSKRVTAELICDGFHVHPAVLRTVFRQLGPERICIISDSMRAAGQPDGVSELGGQTVYVKNGRACLADGTIAGSTTNLLKEVQNLVSFGIPLPDAVRAASLTPAREVGENHMRGSLTPGKYADMLVLDRRTLARRQTIGMGRILA